MIVGALLGKRDCRSASAAPTNMENRLKYIGILAIALAILFATVAFAADVSRSTANNGNLIW